MKRNVLISLAIGVTLGVTQWPLTDRRPWAGWMAVAAPTETPNGQIIQLEGEVQLERQGGQFIRPAVGTWVYPGDKLLADVGSKAVVQCSDLSFESVQGNRDPFDRCPMATERAECNPDAYRCPHRGEITASNPAFPYTIAPRRTYLLDDRPRLRWNPVAEANHYTVTLWKQGVPLWRKNLQTAQMSYPEEVTPLKPGAEYLLAVETDTGALSGDELPIPGGVGFRLLDADRAEFVRNARSYIEQQELDETAKTLAIAFLYTKNDLMTEAIDLLESLVNRQVETAPIYNRLGQLYWEYLGLTAQAEPYYQKAMELADSHDMEIQAEATTRLSQFAKLSKSRK